MFAARNDKVARSTKTHATPCRCRGSGWPTPAPAAPPSCPGPVADAQQPVTRSILVTEQLPASILVPVTAHFDKIPHHFICQHAASDGRRRREALQADQAEHRLQVECPMAARHLPPQRVQLAGCRSLLLDLQSTIAVCYSNNRTVSGPQRCDEMQGTWLQLQRVSMPSAISKNMTASGAALWPNFP